MQILLYTKVETDHRDDTYGLYYTSHLHSLCGFTPTIEPKERRRRRRKTICANLHTLGVPSACYMCAFIYFQIVVDPALLLSLEKVLRCRSRRQQEQHTGRLTNASITFAEMGWYVRLKSYKCHISCTHPTYPSHETYILHRGVSTAKAVYIYIYWYFVISLQSIQKQFLCICQMNVRGYLSSFQSTIFEILYLSLYIHMYQHRPPLPFLHTSPTAYDMVITISESLFMILVFSFSALACACFVTPLFSSRHRMKDYGEDR